MVVIVEICFLSHDNINEHGDYSDKVNDDDQVGVFDMPNPNRYDILSISIF